MASNQGKPADLVSLAVNTGFDTSNYKTFQGERIRPEQKKSKTLTAADPAAAVVLPHSERSVDGGPPVRVEPGIRIASVAREMHRRAPLERREAIESAENFSRTALPLQNLVQFSQWDRWTGLDSVLGGCNDERGYNERPSAPALTLSGACSGVGVSSVISALARIRAKRGHQIVLMDVSSQSLLPLFFGGRVTSSSFATFVTPGDAKRGAVHTCRKEEGDASESPEAWIYRLLDSFSQQSEQFLIDAGAVRFSNLLHGRISDLNSVLMIVPDTRCLAALKRYEETSADVRISGHSREPLLLLNQFDPADPLHAEIQSRLANKFRHRLIPVAIRRDRHVSAALAEGMTVVDYAPESEASEDLVQLDHWLHSSSLPAPQNDLSEKVQIP